MVMLILLIGASSRASGDDGWGPGWPLPQLRSRRQLIGVARATGDASLVGGGRYRGCFFLTRLLDGPL